MGTTLAIFNSVGYYPSAIHKLKDLDIIQESGWEHFFSNLVDIPSQPTLFFDGKLSMTVKTSLGVAEKSSIEFRVDVL